MNTGVSQALKTWFGVGILGVIAFFAGRWTTQYSVPALRLGELHATCVNNEPPRKVDLDGLRPFLERATWISGRAYWKMPFDYVLVDGRKLRVDEVTALFTIDGSPGYYKIRADDEASFLRIFQTR